MLQLEHHVIREKYLKKVKSVREETIKTVNLSLIKIVCWKTRSQKQSLRKTIFLYKQMDEKKEFYNRMVKVQEKQSSFSSKTWFMYLFIYF